MSHHATVEDLSAYLDQQLPDVRQRQVEAHLDRCPACSQRCEGLRKVAASVRHLERLAPPPTLDQTVVRRIELSPERPSLSDRLEEGLGGFQRQSSLLGLFGVMIALAVIMLLFAQAVDRIRNTTIPVVFEDPDWARTSAREETVDGTARRELGGRIFLRTDEGWIQEGVDRAALRRVIAADSPAAQELLARHPELAAVTELEGPVIFEDDGEVVELR